MGKMELEVKILNIDKKEFIEKLEKAGAKFKSDNTQTLYTYDLPTIYGRYVDLLIQINNPESELKLETSIDKLKLLFFEIDNLLTDIDKEELSLIVREENLSKLIKKYNLEELKEILNNKSLIKFIEKFHNNKNKWIRVRETNGKTTIAVKHILASNESNIQQMLETEMKVQNIELANSMLEAIGYSYKSYQEKRRITYLLDEHEIDIDFWPGIPAYAEIEGTSESDLETFLKEIGYSIKDTVSCTADEVYRMYGKSMFDKRELKF